MGVRRADGGPAPPSGRPDLDAGYGSLLAGRGQGGLRRHRQQDDQRRRESGEALHGRQQGADRRADRARRYTRRRSARSAQEPAPAP
ncbi:hypothetical protein ACIP8U_42125 [Streptomyces pseudovenezuelae]|uniref:hypothetical protein n=1 Tax=Streptomyces pseudovenezuelae TaxID=67350 RepID=UPI0036EDBF01